jgi:hypothetical protein
MQNGYDWQGCRQMMHPSGLAVLGISVMTARDQRPRKWAMVRSLAAIGRLDLSGAGSAPDQGPVSGSWRQRPLAQAPLGAAGQPRCAFTALVITDVCRTFGLGQLRNVIGLLDQHGIRRNSVTMCRHAATNVVGGTCW